MVHIFDDITHFEIRVSWVYTTTGYVNGNRFSVEDDYVIFPGHPTFNTSNKKATRDLVRALSFAVRHTPEYNDAKRESKSTGLIVQNGNFPGVYNVNNPLNGSIYNVVLHPNKTYCECADHNYRKLECKHIRAAKKHIEKAEDLKKLANWNYTKKPKYRVITDITDAEIAQAKADLGW